MLRGWITLLLAMAATPLAQAQQVETPSAAPPVEQPDPLIAIQQQLLSAREEIAQLKAANASLQDQAKFADELRARNQRLVDIGNELIAAYDKRYHNSPFLPFALGRTKFERELQDIGDRVYDNQADAAPRRPLPAPDATEPAPDPAPEDAAENEPLPSN